VILERQVDLSLDFLRSKGLSFHPQMTNEQYTEGDRAIRRILMEEFPDAEETIGYYMSMNWSMPYLR
jgi:hypothetical protein